MYIYIYTHIKYYIKCSHTCLAMYAQTNVGLLCCVGSGSSVAAALDSCYTATSTRIMHCNFSDFCYAPTFVPKTRVKISHIVMSTCSTCLTLMWESAGELWAPPPPPRPSPLAGGYIRHTQRHSVPARPYCIHIAAWHPALSDFLQFKRLTALGLRHLYYCLKWTLHGRSYLFATTVSHFLCNSASYKSTTNVRSFIWHSNQDSVIGRGLRVRTPVGTQEFFSRQCR